MKQAFLAQDDQVVFGFVEAGQHSDLRFKFTLNEHYQTGKRLRTDEESSSPSKRAKVVECVVSGIESFSFFSTLMNVGFIFDGRSE